MTSRKKKSNVDPTECFVYITLPGQTKLVTAGKFTLANDRNGTPTGRFIYGKSYLARADSVDIDPTELKLSSKTYRTTVQHGVFGSLRDSGPDFWGRMVIERHKVRASLPEITYLLESPDDRAGALGFGLGVKPPAPKRVFNKTLDLERLQAIAVSLLDENDAPTGTDAEQIEKLMLLGTSMGGARPKAVVEHDGALWLAKFNKPTDRWNNARVEHAILTLANECGITTAQSKLQTVAGKDVLLVKRFDREKVKGSYTRARMVSGITLLRTDDNALSRARWSYVTLVEELRRVCDEPKMNAAELFRRIAFNALVSNIDDHPRNHAIIAKDAYWKLSPAYDLTPMPAVSETHRDLAMSLGDDGRWANAQNLMSQCRRFLLEPDEAAAIIDDVEGIVTRRWHSIARAAGVTERQCQIIAPAFTYAGFRIVGGEAPI